jgi:chromosome segregation ATPase
MVLLPAVIGVGLLATLAGKESVRALFGGDRVERFKADYKQTMLREVDNQLAITRISVEVNDYVEQLYAALKNQLLTELDAHIDQIRNTLEHLRNQKARNETLREAKRQEYEKLLEETQAIRNRAQTLSTYLTEITTV